MRLIAYLGYAAATGLHFEAQPLLALLAVVLLSWLVIVGHFQHRLIPNEGPWNHEQALHLSLTVLPTMAIGLSIFGPLYAIWALLP